MSLDLRELERRLDEALSKETKKTLTAWLEEKRREECDKDTNTSDSSDKYMLIKSEEYRQFKSYSKTINYVQLQEKYQKLVEAVTFLRDALRDANQDEYVIALDLVSRLLDEGGGNDESL